MADEFDRIYTKLDQIDSKIGRVVAHATSTDLTLSRNTDSLEVHMARTAVIEKALLPIRNAYEWTVMTVKIISVLALLGTLTEGVVALLTYIRK